MLYSLIPHHPYIGACSLLTFKFLTTFALPRKIFFLPYFIFWESHPLCDICKLTRQYLADVLISLFSSLWRVSNSFCRYVKKKIWNIDCCLCAAFTCIICKICQILTYSFLIGDRVFFNDVIDQRICRHYYSSLNTQITTHKCIIFYPVMLVRGGRGCWLREGVLPTSASCPLSWPGQQQERARGIWPRCQVCPAPAVTVIVTRNTQPQSQVNRVKIAAQTRRTFLIMFIIHIIAENIF